MALSSPTPVVLQPLKQHVGTVIFLHGLGDSGNGWKDTMSKLQQHHPHIKFILPHAPTRKLTVSGGNPVAAWFDIVIRGEATDTAGLDHSRNTVNSLIEQEEQAGIASSKIIVGGFSQGAVISLYSVFQYAHPLGGCVALSGYLPQPERYESLINPANKLTPVFIRHGEIDHVIPFAKGKASYESLKAFGLTVNWKAMPNILHTVTQEELKDLSTFINERIPDV